MKLGKPVRALCRRGHLSRPVHLLRAYKEGHVAWWRYMLSAECRPVLVYLTRCILSVTVMICVETS